MTRFGVYSTWTSILELPRAFDLARRHQISVAVSNPCIELWFVLHFEDHRAWIDRHAVQMKYSGSVAMRKGPEYRGLGRPL